MIKYVYNAEGKLYSYESSDFIEHNKSKIYRVLDSKDSFIKLFNAECILKENLEMKLTEMNKMSEMKEFCVWPEELLYAEGKFLGYLFKKPKNVVTFPEYMNKYEKETEYQNVHWSQKVRLALQLAECVRLFHEKGYIIGSFSEKNILINEKELKVYFTNCDEFVIKNTNREENSENQNFVSEAIKGSRVVYGENSDNYILAYDLYYLLTGTPYKESTYDCIPDSVKSKFRVILETQYAYSTNYPDTGSWIQLLKQVLENIIVCKNDSNHEYCKELQHCPWCEIQEEKKILLPETENAREEEKTIIIEEEKPKETGDNSYTAITTNSSMKVQEQKPLRFWESKVGWTTGAAIIAIIGSLLFKVVFYTIILRTVISFVYSESTEGLVYLCMKLNLNGFMAIFVGVLVLIWYWARKKIGLIVPGSYILLILLHGISLVGTVVIIFLICFSIPLLAALLVAGIGFKLMMSALKK